MWSDRKNDLKPSVRLRTCRLVCAAALLANGAATAAEDTAKPPLALRGSMSLEAQETPVPALRESIAPDMNPPALDPLGVTGAYDDSLSTAGLTRVLSNLDAERYGDALAAQDEGRWAAADAILESVDNGVLMGHVLAERYLSPGYKSTYAELRSWLTRYGDHPQAERIYALALKRRAKSAPWPDKPVKAYIRFGADRDVDSTRVPLRKSANERQRVAGIERTIRAYLADEKPTVALAHLRSDKVANQLTAAETDAFISLIAASYFYENVPDKAYALAHDVAEARRATIPYADWTAGLAAWRLGKYETAARHFSLLASAERLSPWTRSAAAYWAARSELVSGVPERVSQHLRVAANEPTTFYGLLALRQLGQAPDLDWSLPDASEADLRSALAIPAARRAIALAEIGEVAGADEEMRIAHGKADPRLDRALIALCAEHSLAAAQLHIAEASPHTLGHAALYPVPTYEPQGGFTVDPALIYAFMRQESRFKPLAKSSAGAQGLMQVMPGTAVHVARDKSLKGSNRTRLYDPAYNIKLGQRYIEQLMRSTEPRGNLFMLTVAYNGGPGNLKKWIAGMGGVDDPLLFIESLPSRESRIYVERVLTNLWLYQYRLGEPVASLDMVASGDWPVYSGYDPGGGGGVALTSMLMTGGH